jgi:hypothetical protein
LKIKIPGSKVGHACQLAGAIGFEERGLAMAAVNACPVAAGENDGRPAEELICGLPHLPHVIVTVPCRRQRIQKPAKWGIYFEELTN